MTIGQQVAIPIRTTPQGKVHWVAKGEVVGFKNGLALVKWPDGIVIPYYRDQLASVGTVQPGQPWPVRERVTREAA